MKRRGCAFSFGCCVGSMTMACASLISVPAHEQISCQRGLFLTSMGFIYFISLTNFCNTFMLDTEVGRSFRRKYRLLVSDVLDITNK